MILFCTLFNIQVVCIVVCNLNIGCLIVHWHIVHIVRVSIYPNLYTKLQQPGSGLRMSDDDPGGRQRPGAGEPGSGPRRLALSHWHGGGDPGCDS